jgi:hypothetical protein
MAHTVTSLPAAPSTTTVPTTMWAKAGRGMPPASVRGHCRHLRRLVPPMRACGTQGEAGMGAREASSRGEPTHYTGEERDRERGWALGSTAYPGARVGAAHPHQPLLPRHAVSVVQLKGQHQGRPGRVLKPYKGEGFNRVPQGAQSGSGGVLGQW